MQLARFIGVIVVFGVPAIIIGGLTYHLTHSWPAVAIWEAVNYTLAFIVACKACCKPDEAGGH